ncbi:unnamed protein product [Urochloa humidicola]
MQRRRLLSSSAHARAAWDGAAAADSRRSRRTCQSRNCFRRLADPPPRPILRLADPPKEGGRAKEQSTSRRPRQDLRARDGQAGAGDLAKELGSRGRTGWPVGAQASWV